MAEPAMEFVFYCRDKPNVGALLERNVEAHWSFMDRYADRLLTRGPTLTDDGETHTGSLHIVRLDSVVETGTFAYEEPFYRAGVYDAVFIRRWHDRLGRPMRDFKPDDDVPFYLILGHAEPPSSLAAMLGDRLAVYGWTQPLDGGAWSGFAAILQAPSRQAIKDRLASALFDASLEIHRWRIGGRH
ncbi:YciI family protein [Dongia sedimenti]|uniref:YciI family protein n=1 Tax=Dongia sedimenti TaxID=3064282 RepID=A0ABU0YV18_9PROT|nr:YciI family protein [Rhodospirillaceae bacterium R-7]